LDENYNKKQLLYKQKMNIFYYDIAVSLPLRQCFTYKSVLKIKKGVRVSIPFGNRKVIGVVVKKINTPEILNKNGSIKSIISILDEYPIFDSSIFKTIMWASDYYHHPIGEVFHSFIPTELRKINNKFIAPIESNESHSISVKEVDKIFNLTHDQNKAITRLSKSTGFDPSLLYGVTGSGKTEVYLRLTEHFIKNGKSVLILVPEINLTPQLLLRFESRFKGEIGLYHSKKTPSKRLKVWLKARFGIIKIVIGTRSSVLLPLKDIGLIIIDEEHDQSFRQSEGFKFSARDIGIKRAQEEKIPIILGSATPSLQTLKLVKEEKFNRVDILSRVDGRKPPKLIAMDINNTPLVGGVALETISAIESVLNKGEQVLIFINRRGFAPIYQCGSCGWVADCKSCDSNLVYHQLKQRLICHRCESAYALSKLCPVCKSDDFYIHGSGTERVEEVLQNSFAKTPIIRVDHDTTKKVGAMQAIVEKIHASDSAILVGTQMLAKGHDFPKVTLSVILNADNGLISPEINALEKL
jgi:primosomal protein N' (replication factor Y)